MSDFHWRDGWHFKREENGDVTFYNADKGFAKRIPGLEWVSIVTEVAKKSQAETHSAVMELHAPEKDE